MTCHCLGSMFNPECPVHRVRSEDVAIGMGWRKEVHNKGTLHESTVWYMPDGQIYGGSPVRDADGKGHGND